ncbi:CD276 antigen homolog isoform X1 [Lates calcarifer]|uniref:CD276 antigen homolog isoform X1 n=1 Tax=Lates calcarifer TaxID=8187 RepID=A0AAJ7V9H1_LATCA|nr:CD276 antigen homolog isoform X1 [Lates calcarifer]XP_018541886.1 CD276 antigen homolog isoform X1 [Lates calcarifer]
MARLCLLVLTATMFGDGHGPSVTRVVVKEGNDATLPCSLSTRQNITSELFDWKKDGQKEVFLYAGGETYSNGRMGQDAQFTNRVSHFPEELSHGNSSIIIRDAEVADSGSYTCDFPHLEQKSYIWLVVNRDPQRPTLTDRSGEVRGAAPRPYVTIVNVTEKEAVLQCEVLRASPKPKVKWQSSDGNVLPAEEPHVSERGGRYDVTLLTTVTKTTTNRFRCVATQEDIGHVTHAEITVTFCESTCGDSAHRWSPVGICVGLVIGVVLTLGVEGLVLALHGVPKCITRRFNKGSPEQRNGVPRENGSAAVPLQP